jgi:hypothetical protein
MAPKRESTPHPRPRRLPAGRQLQETIEGMLAWPNVRACFVGRKQVKGKETGRLALVCGVEEKIPEKSLPNHEILPKSLPLHSLRGRTTRIPTDVVPMGGRFDIQATVLGPADIINPDRPSFRGTAGIALRHPTFGDVVTTAGHVVPPGLPSGARVIIESGGNSFPAQVVSVRTDQFSDHALLRPDSPGLLGNFFRDVTPLGPPHIPDPQTDVHARLFILPSMGDVREVQCRGLTASVQTAPNIVMNNLILTDFCTEGGDSGACLVDRNWKVWGLLIGVYRGTNETGDSEDFSVFVPAFRVLSLESARFL